MTARTTPSIRAAGRSAAFTKRAAVLTICVGSGRWPSTVRWHARIAWPEEAKTQFQKSWDAWKAWAKLEEVAWASPRALALLPCPGSARQLGRARGLGWQVPLGSASLPTARGTKRRAT